MHKIRGPACGPEDRVAAGMDGRVGWGKRPLILVVDMIRFFTDPQSPFRTDLTACIADINKILAVSRANSIPILFVSVAYHDPDFEGGLLVRKAPALRSLLHGSDLTEVDPRLGRRSNEPLLYKQYSSCFFGTPLQGMLQASGIDTLVLCGTVTSGCIRATATDCVQMGFHCIVPETAVCDMTEEAHRAALSAINALYADVVDVDEALEELERIGASIRQS